MKKERTSAVRLAGALAAAILILTLPTAPLFAQSITEIIGANYGRLDYPQGVAADSAGNVYVAGAYSDNVFKITPGGTITPIIDSTGDGTNRLNYPSAVAFDSADNVYVAGADSNNVFKIAVAPCAGDCDRNGVVTVDDILTMVNIALGNAETTECRSGDANEDGQITVDEILQAVSNALNG
jgi:hypothetical protein